MARACVGQIALSSSHVFNPSLPKAWSRIVLPRAARSWLIVFFPAWRLLRGDHSGSPALRKGGARAGWMRERSHGFALGTGRQCHGERASSLGIVGDVAAV